MPGFSTTEYGGGDYTWMRNTDGIDDSALTGSAPKAGFTEATHYPDGYMPSGLPLRVDDLDNIRPWADVAGARLGFLKGDHKVTADAVVNIAFVPRGNINTANLPVAFTAPTAAGAGLQPQFFLGA